jgi:protein TonB
VPAAVSKLPELPPATEAAAGGEDAGRAALGDPVGVPGSTGDTPGALVPGAGADAGDAPLVIGGDVRAPSLLERSDPEYPEVARKARLEGVVILQAVIGTDGRVEEIGVVKSASPILDEAAIRAVRRWRYRAATLNGKAVRVYLTVTADFRLR